MREMFSNADLFWSKYSESGTTSKIKKLNVHLLPCFIFCLRVFWRKAINESYESIIVSIWKTKCFILPIIPHFYFYSTKNWARSASTFWLNRYRNAAFQVEFGFWIGWASLFEIEWELQHHSFCLLLFLKSLLVAGIINKV